MKKNRNFLIMGEIYEPFRNKKGQIHGYERDGGVDNIIHNLHTSPRQFYRYLDIAYMNPDKINEILSGKLKINVNDLFQIAQECCL